MWDLDDGARVHVVDEATPTLAHPDNGVLVAWSAEGDFEQTTLEPVERG